MLKMSAKALRLFFWPKYLPGSVQLPVIIVQCMADPVQLALYCVQSMLYNRHYVEWSVCCAVNSIECRLYKIACCCQSKGFMTGCSVSVAKTNCSTTLLLQSFPATTHYPVLSNIRHNDFRAPSVRRNAQGTPPPWILKRGGLESCGQRLISSIGKTKIIAF